MPPTPSLGGAPNGPARRSNEHLGTIALIGDVGGHAAELATALDVLGCDVTAGTVPVGMLVVQLGDLVDRGPDSAGAVDLADRFIHGTGGRYVQLFGNHEGHRFADLGLTHAGPLPTGTLATIRRWWSAGRARLALALDTDELGPTLVTHAGLSPATWRAVGAPRDPRQAATRLNRWVGTDAGRAFTPRTDRAVGPFRPGVTWGEPADLYAAWLAEADPPPFAQVHAHASAWSWKHRRWRKSTPQLVRDNAVDIDPRRCHLRVDISGRAFVGIDPGHLEEPRTPWTPLLLTPSP